MGGGDKILNHINADCDKRISEINAEADIKCSSIIADGQKQAQQLAAEIAKKTESKLQQIKAASKSRAELEVRNALLKKRREEIDITYNSVVNYMINLSDKEYFDIIYLLAKKVSSKEGTIALNEKDLQRLPSDFISNLKKIGIEAQLCSMPAKISGGFILKCGDIEENMDFAAILADKRDLIEDLINSQLFTA